MTRTIFIVTGEHSGDALGAKLMAALKTRLGDGALRFEGLGGHAMEAEGLKPLFSLDEVAVMGPIAIIKQYPKLRRRALECVEAGVTCNPDLVVIIDAPEFTHPIAKRIRKRLPHVPIVDYVSPSVWAWRPGRAKKMQPYVDHLLALLPFEPAAHERLGGPPCTYVGHPLVERQAWIDALDPSVLADRLGLASGKQVIVVLPGSRGSEVRRLMQPFGETLGGLKALGREFEVIIPAVPRLREKIAEAAENWPIAPHIVVGEEDKWRAFKMARAALAASGTVTLELAVAGTPAIVAYRVDPLAAQLRFLVKVPSIVLANLVLDENVYPEFIQEECAPDKMAPALATLLDDGPARASQLKGLSRISDALAVPHGSPSARAAEVVERVLVDPKTSLQNS